jgi:membrane protein YdbS with pleckstrin-like domain
VFPAWSVVCAFHSGCGFVFVGSVGWAVSWKSFCVLCDVFVVSLFAFPVGQYPLSRWRRRGYGVVV